LRQNSQSIAGRDVDICTSIHNAEFGNTRKNDRNTGQAIQKPVAILDYDKYMGAMTNNLWPLFRYGFMSLITRS
jgi:hypothetical protein